MGLRYEAWSLPWDSGGFKRRVAKLPVPIGAGRGSKVFLSTTEDGAIELNHSQFQRTGELISGTVGSLIRVYDGVDVIHEWLAERNPENLDDEDRRFGVTGPGLKAAFDKAFVYPADYPVNPTKQPNHVWAGEDALTDGGMEEANTQNETYEIQLDGATGGTFTLTVGGDTTGALAFDATPAQIEAAIEGLASTPDILDVRVDTTSDGWNIEFVDPAILDTNMTWTPSLTGTGGDEDLVVTQEGTDDIPAHWTVSKNPASSSDPKLHGSYGSDGFRLTTGTEPVRSGERALRVNGLSQYSGAQQIVNVEPGARYQASIWVWSSDTTESFKLVMRDQYGRWVAQALFANTTGSQWEQLTIDFVTELPDGTPVDTLIFRMAQIVDHNPIPFYLDDASLKFGAPATTIGDILQILFADVQSDHSGDTRGISLEWVDVSGFTDTLDSNGNAWTSNHSFEASFGETYGQVLDKVVDLDYEWDLVPKVTPSGGLTHDLIVTNTGGIDDDPSTAINVKQGVVGGDVVKRIPAYTKVVVEGADGLYVEVEDATASGNFGPTEKHFAARHLSDIVSLTQLANNLLAAESSNRNAVQFQIVDTGRHPVPLRTYTTGDTIPMQMPPALPKEERRVQRVDYTNTFPTSYIVTGSRVLGGEAAAFDLVRRLWRRFERPKRELRSGVSPLQSAGGGGSTPTIFIACSDSSSESKRNAHLVASGTDDAEVWNAALDLASFFEQPTSGVRIVVSEGKLFVNPSNPIVVTDNVHLQGLGSFRTQIVNEGDGALGQHLVEVQTDGELSDIGFNTDFTYLGRQVFNDFGRLSNIWFQGEAEAAIWIIGGQHPIDNIMVSGRYSDAGVVVDGGWVLINNGIFQQAGTAIRFDSSATPVSTLTNCVIASSLGDGIELDGGEVAISACSIRVPGHSALVVNDASPFSFAITGCFIEADYGVEMTGAFPSWDNSVVSDSVIEADITAFKLSLGRRCIISNNFIWGRGQHIVEMTDCVDTVFSDNLIWSRNIDADDTYDVIRLISSDRVRVSDNNIVVAGTNLPRYGISIDAASNDNIVVGNSFGPASGYGTDPLLNLGTDTSLFYPANPTYGDNFVTNPSGGGGATPQSKSVQSTTETEAAQSITPVQP